MFEEGKIYKRSLIHEEHGGQEQYGICTPSQEPSIFIFTGETGTLYGYKDEWTSEDTYLYTGQGQIGDMKFKRGNKAIRDHLKDNEALFLFNIIGNGNVKFISKMELVKHMIEDGIDKNGNLRKIIRFELKRIA